MVRGLYTAYTGMRNEQKRLDVISNNLANSATAGYKKASVSNRAFDDVLAIKIRDGSDAYIDRPIGTMNLGVKIGEEYTDYAQGSVRQTGGTYDMALSGEGFFKLRYVDKQGNVSYKYTRDGSFTITSDGYITDANGNRLQGRGGDIVIPAGATTIAIGKTGAITADGTVIDTLALTDFEDYNYLKKFGDNMYEPVEGATEKNCTATVEQGYIEQSNVNVVSEMVSMIAVTRAYEANSKVIKTMDNMLDKAVNSVGRLG